MLLSSWEGGVGVCVPQGLWKSRALARPATWSLCTVPPGYRGSGATDHDRGLSRPSYSKLHVSVTGQEMESTVALTHAPGSTLPKRPASPGHGGRVLSRSHLKAGPGWREQ